MIELYLFINPTCLQCEHAEKTAKKVFQQFPKNISLRFIPLRKLTTFDNTSDPLLPAKLVMDYKAALLQGSAAGRNLLISEQDAFCKLHHPYNEKEVYELAAQLHLDIEMFKEDRDSPLANKAWISDQHLISEMHVTTHGELVIMDCERLKNGLLLQSFDYAQLFGMCSDFLKADQQAASLPNKRRKFKIL